MGSYRLQRCTMRGFLTSAGAIAIVGFTTVNPAAASPSNPTDETFVPQQQQLTPLAFQLQSDEDAIRMDEAGIDRAQQIGNRAALEQYKHDARIHSEQLAYDRGTMSDQNDSRRGW